MTLPQPTMRRDSWPFCLSVAAGTMAVALVLTHAFWSLFRHTPLVLGFGAAALSSRIGGRKAGVLAVVIGTLAYAWLPPPLPAGALGHLLLGFVAISGAFSWMVARRYEIEAALRSSEARLTEAQQVAHVGSWEWNIADNSELWSDELYRICGVDPAWGPPSYERFIALLPVDDRERVNGIAQKALADRQPFQFEHRIVRPDGTVRLLNSVGRVVADDSGEVVRMVGVAQDITDRKAAEDIVRRSERRLQTIIDAAPACVTLVSRDGLLLEINRAGLEMVGVTDPAQVVGQQVCDLIHPEDRERYRETHQAAFSGSPARLEFRISGSHGRDRWVDSYAVPFDASIDTNDEQPAVLSVINDITERVHAQRALHDAEERIRFALEASRLGVWETNLTTGISHWSETCEVLHGLERGTFGKSFPAFIECIHPDDRNTVLQTIDDAIREHRAAEIEYRTVLSDGTERRISSTGHFFYDDTGVPLRGAGVSIDVTETRALEAQLRQAQRMEAIGQLAGGISHDFNNLLTAIGGYSEIVLGTLADGDKRREDLQEVVKAARRAAALTRQLLAVSRRQILEPTVLDVNGMLADFKNLLRRTIPENIALQLELSPVVAPVRADRGQLEQVVLNLAINAGDAMPQGGHLRIATDTVDVDEAWTRHHAAIPAGRYVRLMVSDTGIGMSQETRTHIFEPFFTTKAPEKGTGLGLATVYGIVKQSDGFIWVDSHVGRGTTFEIYLPVVYEPVAEPVQVAPPVDRSAGSQTILLAEDDDPVRRFARDVLLSQGYTVLDARDGEEALAIARGYPQAIDLLVTDVVMPGLSGRDLAARLTLERPDVRVIYTSGYTERFMMQSGFEYGLTLLPKPFLRAELLRKVGDTLGTGV